MRHTRSQASMNCLIASIMLTATVSTVQSESNIDSSDGENLRVLLPPLQAPVVSSLLQDTESRVTRTSTASAMDSALYGRREGEVAASSPSSSSSFSSSPASLSRSPVSLLLGTLVVSETKDEAKSELVRTLGPLRDFSQDNSENSPQVTLDSLAQGASSPDSTIVPIDSPLLPPPPVTPLKHLDERCLLPKKEGSCFALFTRYAFDVKTKKCHEFIYSGCNGNGNNFQQPEECVKACNARGITKLAISVPIQG